MYLHACEGKLAHRPTTSASCRPSALDVYLHEYLDKLAQRSPALTPVDKQTWTCICSHAQASWRSACRHCLALTIGPELCHASSYSAYRGCIMLTNGPAVYLHACSGELALRLPTLLPANNQQRTCTCMNTQESWCRLTSLAYCRKAALHMCLYTCCGELVQHLPAFRLVDNQHQLVSGELAQHLPVQTALPPVEKRPPLCTCTHTRATLLTANQHGLLLTTGHERVPARIPAPAAAS